jgi:hypothetical protein
MRGLRLIDETLAGMALTGKRVRHGEFEGELLLARSPSNHEAAETCFRQPLEIARAQDARAWELRAAISLGRLLAPHDRADPARRMLGELYSWFTEPLVDTADLRDAKRLLERGRGSNLPRLPAPVRLRYGSGGGSRGGPRCRGAGQERPPDPRELENVLRTSFYVPCLVGQFCQLVTTA